MPALIRDVGHLNATDWQYGALLSMYPAMQFLFVPSLAMLFVSRAIAGITGANMSVASAYVTDITAQADRARRFGQMCAMFGIGFIIGPILGGTLGLYWVRAPFIAASVLNAVNLVMIWFVVPKTRKPSGAVALPRISVLDPIKPMMMFRPLWGLIFVTIIFACAAEVAGTILTSLPSERVDGDNQGA